MRTVVPMTEIPDRELADHLGDVLRRVEAGEELIVTVDGHPVAELRPVPRGARTVSWQEFMSWPKADRGMLDDIRELLGDETTDDVRDPWERSGDAR